MTEMTEEQELAQIELAMAQFEIAGVKPTSLDSGYPMFDVLGSSKKVGNLSVVSTTYVVFDGDANNASELIFDSLIGDTGLCRQFEESPIGSSFFWTPLEASRLLSGIEPDNYPEGANSVIGSRRSGAVENARVNADSAYRKMTKTELGKRTPWEWLDWADEAHVKVYPACRRLIEFLRSKLKPAKQRREDLLSMELSDLLNKRKLQGQSNTPKMVMQALQEKVGRKDTCIFAKGLRIIEWRNCIDEVQTLTISILASRIKRWKIGQIDEK